MTITLFHRTLGWAIGALALAGACAFLEMCRSWLDERFTLGFPYLLAPRWDRPKARVTLPDGRGARVLEVHYGGEAGDMATVLTYGSGGHERAEWVPVHHLEPARRAKPEEVAS
jgi:hypothetical protein